jgi:hypothetical protein
VRIIDPSNEERFRIITVNDVGRAYVEGEGTDPDC